MNLLEFIGLLTLLIGGIIAVPKISRTIFTIALGYMLIRENFIVTEPVNILQTIAPFAILVGFIAAAVIDVRAMGGLRFKIFKNKKAKELT